VTYCVLDVETTIFQKGNPFSQRNKLVVVGVRNQEYSFLGMDRQLLQEYINKSNLLVGFNIKFDLHWIQNHGLNFSHCRIWDCQLAHFLLRGQSHPYPSLNSVAAWYGIGTKHSIVSEEYWEKGIDTDRIPPAVLYEYLQQDLLLTEEVYKKQLEEFGKDPQLYKLFKLQCLDLLVLQEMEHNGMIFDSDEATKLARVEESHIREIEFELQQGYEHIPINWQSRDHLSCYLYGGRITTEDRMPVGVYKTGAKIGQPRYKKIEHVFDLPRLIEPPKGSELAKEGYYATDEGTLRSIKCNKQSRKRLDLILERSQASKLVGTYYRGIPELIEEMDWPSGRIHGSFNQCVATTGRLSSSKPNLQNFAGEVDKLLISEYQ
jgi:DNA polymerase I-like protein with 3'-5' exonuclease and polymerase domains